MEIGWWRVKHRWKNVTAPLIEIGAVLLVWHMVSRSGTLSAYALPPSSRVLQSFIKMLVTGELWEDIYISFIRVMKGFIITSMLAFVLGMARVLLPASGKYYEYMVQFFRNVPPLSMILLLILWYGIGETTKTVIIVLASFFPMYLNIVKGLIGCDRGFLEVGDMFRYFRGRKFLRIILPYTSANILVGMRIGLGYSWRVIIGAEMVAVSAGLGHMILLAQQMSRTDEMIVGILVIGMVGYVTDRIFALAISKSLKGSCNNGWD